MIRNAQSDGFVIGKDETGSTLLRCASDASPVVLPIASIQEITDD